MREVLAACRRAFGEAPRRFGVTQWGYLTFDPPPWVDEENSTSLLSGTSADALATYRGQRDLRRHGRVVWGVLVQANRMLFRPGSDDLGAAIVYSEDPYFDDAPEELRSIAERIGELYQGGENHPRPPTPPGLAPLVDALAPGDRSLVHVPLPPDFTGGRAVAATYIHVPRQYMPEGHLVTNTFPVIVAPEQTAGVTPLPSACWPEELVVAWVSGSIDDLRRGRVAVSPTQKPSWRPRGRLSMPASAPRSGPTKELADAIAAAQEVETPDGWSAVERAFVVGVQADFKGEMPVEAAVETMGALVAVGQRADAAKLLGTLERWAARIEPAAATEPRWATMRDLVRIAGAMTDPDARGFGRDVIRWRLDAAVQTLERLVRRDHALRKAAARALRGSTSPLGARLGPAIARAPSPTRLPLVWTVGAVVALLAGLALAWLTLSGARPFHG